jgi:hypothetical protein
MGFLLDVIFWCVGGPRGVAEIASLWHLVCQKCACQGMALDGSAENKGNLTFWHLVCQK